MTYAGVFSCGWTLYVKDSRPEFRHTFFELAEITIQCMEKLPEGKLSLRTEFVPDGTPVGSGTLKKFVNGKAAGEDKVRRLGFRHRLELPSKSAATRSLLLIRSAGIDQRFGSPARSERSPLSRPHHLNLTAVQKIRFFHTFSGVYP